MSANGLLKMSELAERSGVSAGTIKHYLREGLLGGRDEVKKTSRNMAWYPPEYVERVRLIKRLQERRYMPLKAIRRVLDEEEDPARLAALAEVEDRILEPVLDLDEALDSELVRAREMVVQVDQPGTDGVSLLGVPVKLSRTPGAPAGPGPALGEHTRAVLDGLGYSEEEIGALMDDGAAA